jgi:hypothetical protein
VISQKIKHGQFPTDETEKTVSPLTKDGEQSRVKSVMVLHEERQSHSYNTKSAIPLTSFYRSGAENRRKQTPK